jgi:hypothetical protein
MSKEILKSMQNPAYSKQHLQMERKKVYSVMNPKKKVVKRNNKLGPKHGTTRNEG